MMYQTVLIENITTKNLLTPRKQAKQRKEKQSKPNKARQTNELNFSIRNDNQKTRKWRKKLENVRFWETVTCVIIEKHKRKQGKKMKILAFDTSSTALSVALLEDEKLVAESTVTVKKNHSISLMPTIDFLVAQAGWQPSDLERIVVAQGPGSYTGLRVAVATAKTLAYALDIDLVGVSSLQALTDLTVDGVVIPIMDFDFISM